MRRKHTDIPSGQRRQKPHQQAGYMAAIAFPDRAIEKKMLAKKIGESLFLRKLVLGIPAQASGKNLTRPLMPAAAPAVLLPSFHTQQGV
jgi:hypothetical protein